MRMNETGFSLVEILVAMAVSVFLLAGIYATYIANKKTFAYQEGMARLQENIRMALYQLNHDIRMAGYIGCPNWRDINIHSGEDTLFSESTMIVGWHNNRSTASISLPSLIQQRAVVSSDILLIQEMEPDTTDITQVDKNQIKITGKTHFKENENIIIANCHHVDLTQINNIIYHKPYTFLTVTSNLQNANYAQTAQAGKFLTLYYYIGKTNRKNSAGNFIYALYQQENGSTKPAEIVEGVENMHLYFGVLAADHSQLNYFTADTVSDWTQIYSVKVVLLFDSIESVSDRSQGYEFDHHYYPPIDRRLRKEIDITIALRERLP